MWGWSDAPCATTAPSLCEMRPVGNFSYDVAAAAGDPAGSGTVYTLVTAAAGFEAAQLACNGIGGHLAAFSSVAEQRGAEQYFVQLVGVGSGGSCVLGLYCVWCCVLHAVCCMMRAASRAVLRLQQPAVQPAAACAADEAAAAS